MSREVIIKVLSEEEISQREEEAKLLNEFDTQYKQYSFRTAVVSPYENMGELVRCKDCKFNDGYCKNEALNSHLEPLGLDGGALFETSPDFYCAYGRRKEEC